MKCQRDKFQISYSYTFGFGIVKSILEFAKYPQTCSIAIEYDIFLKFL